MSKNIKWLKISECFETFNGMTNVTNKWDNNGNCLFIDFLNVYNNLSVNVNKVYWATVKSLKQNSLKKGDILITSGSETLEDFPVVSVIEKEIKDNIFLDDHLFGLRLNKEYANIINPSFFKFYFNSNEFKIECI